MQVSDSTRMNPHLLLPNSTHLYICMMLLDTFLCHVVTLLFLLALIFLLTISQNHLLFFFLPFNDNYFFFFPSLCVCLCVLDFHHSRFPPVPLTTLPSLSKATTTFTLVSSLSLPPSSIIIKSVRLLALFGKKKLFKQGKK